MAGSVERTTDELLEADFISQSQFYSVAQSMHR
jgi:hypothetical protein